MAPNRPREVQVFIASPSDVAAERARVDRAILRLNRECAETVHFRTFRWEKGFYSAHAQPQDLIMRPGECDIVLVLFGHRLGSPMPDNFSQRMSDGAAYPSGTAYELLSAIGASERQGGRPAVFVFRSLAQRIFHEGQDEQWAQAKAERQRLDSFFDQHFGIPGGETKRLHHTFRSADDLAAQVDELLRQWANLSLRAAPQWLVERDGSPFPGLDQFDRRHSRVYFGRSRKVERAAQALVAAAGRDGGLPFLLVVGSSGSGKSSLVRAGLVPRLAEGNLLPEIDAWRVAVMRPGAADTPFLALAQSLYVDGHGDSDPGGFGPALPELAAGAFATQAGLARLLDDSPRSAAAPIVSALAAAGQAERTAGGFDREVRVNLLLVVDQLEEIYADDVPDPVRDRFAGVLSALAETRRVWIVATMRADLYPSILRRSPFLALKDAGGFYDLASPGPAEISEILEQSARVAGLDYGTDPATGERLDERLHRDAAGDDTLPLLQFSLQRLYEEREPIVGTSRALLTFDSYHRMGGLDGAISERAEATIAKPGRSTTETDHLLGRLLRQLVIRVVTHSDLAAAGAPGFTIRAAPLAAAAPDFGSRQLVDDLVRARLVSLHAENGTEPTVRLAHERVLATWARARDLLSTYRDYFRIRADIEQQAQRWQAGDHRREFLLQPGSALTEAERVVRNFSEEIPPKLRGFVDRSGRRARWSRNLRLGAIAALVLLTVVSAGSALIVKSAERKAQRNYSAAKGAADQLVLAIASSLRDQETISAAAIDSSFEIAERLLASIRDTVVQRNSSADNGAVGWIQAHFSDASSADEMAALDLSQSDLLYEFAETYHRAAKQQDKAYAMASVSLAIRERLEPPSPSPQLERRIAESQMLLADLERSKLEAGAPRGAPSPDFSPDFSPVRALLETAIARIAPLHAARSGDAQITQDYSKLLTRLGDLDQKANAHEQAMQHYADAQRLALAVFRDAPTDPRALNEIAWTYRKTGEVDLGLQRFDAAFDALADEVCARHEIIRLRLERIKPQQDLGFALQNLGAVRLRQGRFDDPRTHDAIFAALTLRMRLAKSNPSQKVLFTNILLSLAQARAWFAGRNETAFATPFDQAATAMKAAIPDAFPDLAKVDQAHATLLRERADALQQHGPMAMLGDGRITVERLVSDFERDTEPQLEHEANGCWGRLTQVAELAR